MLLLAACSLPALQSVSSTGTQGNGISYGGVATGDAHKIAFASTATNLVPNDTNGNGDLFVRDTANHTTTRVSVGPNGVQGNGISGSGDERSAGQRVTPDGRYIAFDTTARNLDPTVTVQCCLGSVAMLDTTTGTVRIVSLQPNGTPFSGSIGQLAGLSDDGRYVLFSEGLFYLRDRAAGTTTPFPGPGPDPDGICGAATSDGIKQMAMNGDATKFVYEVRCEVNGEIVAHLVYVNRTAGTHTDFHQVHMADTSHDDDTIGPIVVSNDGMSVVWSDVTPKTATTRTLWSWHPNQSPAALPATGVMFGVAVSRTGRYVAWSTVLPETSSQSRIFVLDRTTNAIAEATRAPNGTVANSSSSRPSFSNDESTLVFDSIATNLVSSDTNGVRDVFTVPIAPLFASSASG
jgi:hypothetical protein